jgi:branched-chain amino acid transport system ATP-binding protein
MSRDVQSDGVQSDNVRSGDMRLVVENLDVYYDRVHVLQDVSFEIGAQPVAMVGRNGMGKTTLAKALMGLVAAESGSVRFGDRELLGAQSYRIVKAGIGYVPQGRRIWPSLSTHEHLVMVGAKASARWSVDTVTPTASSSSSMESKLNPAASNRIRSNTASEI